MFRLDTWVQNINLENNIFCFVDDITESKKYEVPNSYKYKCLKLINTKYQDYYKIYTDGSKEVNGLGAAILDQQQSNYFKFKIDTRVSIMYIELFAIAYALSDISTICHNKFVILTDARSALQHVARCTSNFRGTPIAYNILKTIQYLKQLNKHVILQ